MFLDFPNTAVQEFDHDFCLQWFSSKLWKSCRDSETAENRWRRSRFSSARRRDYRQQATRPCRACGCLRIEKAGGGLASGETSQDTIVNVCIKGTQKLCLKKHALLSGCVLCIGQRRWPQGIHVNMREGRSLQNFAGVLEFQIWHSFLPVRVRVGPLALVLSLRSLLLLVHTFVDRTQGCSPHHPCLLSFRVPCIAFPCNWCVSG